MKSFVNILFFLLTIHVVIAQDVIIKGSAIDFKSEIVKLQVPSDPFSGRYTTISRDTIKADGSFTLKSVVSEVKCARIKIGIVNLTLFLEPNKSYLIKVPLKTELVDNTVVQRFKSFIPIEESADIQNQDSLALNFQIACFNDLFNKFMIQHQQEFKFKRNKVLVNTLKEQVKLRFPHPMAYLKEYIEFRMLSVEIMERLISNKDIVERYYKGKKPLYNNSEYIDFFNDFYSNCLKTLKTKGFRDTLRYAINVEKSYISLIKIVASDSTLLPSDTLRELITIKGLYESYNDPDFTKEGITTVLQFIAEKSNVPEHQEIAASLVKSLRMLEPGSIAPPFYLADLDGKMHSLVEYKGKLVCLNFWASWNVPSLEEFKAMDTIRKRFGKNLEIVSVSVDNNLEGLKAVLNSYRLKCGSLNYCNYKDIIDDYDIVGIPTFVLIDEQGRIINANTKHPSEGLLEYLEALFASRELERQRQFDAKKRERDSKRVDDINNTKKNKKK